jgi:hypothetical protein
MPKAWGFCYVENMKTAKRYGYFAMEFGVDFVFEVPNRRKGYPDGWPFCV